jgi:uncharacterized protein (DUF1697 family)
MHPAKLKWAFEKMGFRHVRTVISSGNVVFESSSKNAAALEKKVEAALPKLLGFSSTTIIRSQEELEKLIARNPYKGIVHGKKYYTLVTFLKEHSGKLRTLPRTGPGFKIVGVYKKEFCAVYDLSRIRTPDMLVRFEKEFNKAITTRTWLTVERIVKKMNVH